MDLDIQNLSSGGCLKAFEEEYFAPPKPIYYYETPKKKSFLKSYFPHLCNSIRSIFEIAKKCLAIIIFPAGLIYCLVNYFRNKILSARVDKSIREGLKKLYRKYLGSESGISLKRPFLSKCIIKRVPVAVDGRIIDGVICSPSQEELKSKKWVLYSPSSIQSYENFIRKLDFGISISSLQILCSLGYNVLVFNYPGVGSSKGKKSLNECKKAFLGYLAFLEDEEKGLGAEEITFFAPSLGAAVQSLGLEKHNFKSSIKYRAIYYQGMSSLYKATKCQLHKESCLRNRVLYRIVLVILKCLFLYDWGINVAKKVQNSKIPTIVAQAFNKGDKESYSEKDLMLTDGTFKKTATLAYGLFKKNVKNENIYFESSESRHMCFSIEFDSLKKLFDRLDKIDN